MGKCSDEEILYNADQPDGAIGRDMAKELEYAYRVLVSVNSGLMTRKYFETYEDAETFYLAARFKYPNATRVQVVKHTRDMIGNLKGDTVLIWQSLT